MPQLYGVYRSRATRPLWLAAEAGLPLDLVPVVQAYRLKDPDAPGAPRHTRSAEFLALSPQGAIPVYRDGDLVLSESMAILLHMAREAGDFGPRDAGEAALMQQWAFYAITAIEPAALKIVYDADPEGAHLDPVAEALARPLAVLDGHLQDRSHMVGDRFTAADIAVAECLRYAQGRATLMARYPNVTRWLAACQSRPAFVEMMRTRAAEPETPDA